MAKLDTTIDNLERKSNKVLGDIPSSDWTDAQYPSAKTLYNTYKNLIDLIDLIHPVGSIITTSTKTDPGETVGGSWELIDKAFADNWITLEESNWTSEKGNIYVASSSATSSARYLLDHTISLRLHLEVSEDITDDTANLGTIDLGACGVSRLSHAITDAVAISDGGQCTICYRIDTNGKISITDVLNINGTHKMAAGSNFIINIVLPIRADYMLDSYCDKFYWKRLT